MYFIGRRDVKVDFYSTVDPWFDGSVVLCVYVCAQRDRDFNVCVYVCVMSPYISAVCLVFGCSC